VTTSVGIAECVRCPCSVRKKKGGLTIREKEKKGQRKKRIDTGRGARQRERNQKNVQRIRKSNSTPQGNKKKGSMGKMQFGDNFSISRNVAGGKDGKQENEEGT